MARWFSAVLGALSVLLLGLLAKRITGRNASWPWSSVVLAGLTPWLFELGRVALEVATQPLLVTSLLLALHRAWRQRTWTARKACRSVCCSGMLLYSYTGNRLLAPLLAAALAVFAGRGRWRCLLAAWRTFASACSCRSPSIRAASSRHGHRRRYGATTIARAKGTLHAWVAQAIANWFHDIDPWFWATSGDPAPYVHNGGYGSLFGAVVVLALVGLVLVLWRRRDDLWWR